MTAIQSLLTDPNPNSPANGEAARLYRDSRKEYDTRVRAVVEQSWEDDDDAGEEEDEEDEETEDKTKDEKEEE